MDVQPPQSPPPAFPEEGPQKPMPEGTMMRYVQHRQPVARPPSLTAGDIYYILFRQKWKIMFCSAAGVFAAVALFVLMPMPYESEAKLFIRYVLEGKSPSPAGPGSDVRSPDQGGEKIINSEGEILSSYDLAQQVADTIGPEKVLAKVGGGHDRIAAGAAISQRLIVEVPSRSSVIRIAFRHPDPEIVQPVLRQLIEIYLKRHVQIHQTTGVSDDLLMQQIDQLRSRLAQTEQDLRAARKAAGVISLDETKRVYTEQISRIRQEIFVAEADLAERQAGLKGILKLLADASPATTNTTTAGVALAAGVLEQYRGVSARLEALWRRREELLTQFTEENELVRGVRGQVAEAEALKKKLEQTYPQLLVVDAAPAQRQPEQPGRLTADPATELTRIAALESRIKVLNSQLDQLRTEAATVDAGESTIVELQRKKELQEANYRHFAASLEQARFDEAIGAGKVSNISVVQVPSPPLRAHSKTLKLMAGAILGGFFGGLALAFLIELKLDRSLRRPGEIEAKLRLPLFLSIPFITARTMRRHAHGPRKRSLFARAATGAAAAAGGSGLADRTSSLEMVPWEGILPLHPFHEALRDRLIAHFEASNLTHKPKLIAVTSPGRGSGVTTTAAGLAASLSETGDGNVLLVDMNPQQGAAQQFHRGKPIGGLDEALYAKENALVQDNLYVVAEGSNGDKLAGALPKRFSQLLPKLKVSDYDYIIFDMPPISQTSVTPRLAKFMDAVLLIIESEQTDRGLAQQANALLAGSKANVYAVLNKTRTYVPARLHQEFLSEP